MGQFPASGIKINREFMVNVNGDAGTDRHEDRIEALRLALLEPAADLVAAAGQGLAEDIGAGVAGHAVAGPAGIIDQCGDLGGGRSLCGGLHRHHADALGQEGRGVDLALTTDTGDALVVGDPAQRALTNFPMTGLFWESWD